jgi:hypothetical protein
MRTLKKITAGIFFMIGLLLLFSEVSNLVSPTATDSDKKESLEIIAIMSLPSIGIGTWIVWGLRQDHLKKLKQLDLQREQQFLRILQQKEGEITVTAFALAAQIPIDEAKLYLDKKAKQLNASFQPTNEGGIIYKFPI